MPGPMITLVAIVFPLHGSDVRAPSAVFDQIFEVFLLLGTAVGVVVVAYTMYHALKYRDDGSGTDPYADKVERPEMGELPTGGSGGRKVFYSFSISAIIVVSLIAWTYSQLLYIEQGPDPAQEEALEIDVEGYRFGWDFIYPNGHTTNTLYVPQDRVVRLRVTSTDVFHNFGIPAVRVKTDAVPGQYTSAWFTANETGTYTAKCYELCGSGHSLMTAEVVVLSQDEYGDWYNGTAGQSGGQAANGTTESASLGTPTAGTAPDATAGGVGA
ncbi:cytochrome c oxidase subunit II [Haloarcula sp. Atlit-47R]|uniref:cytochrome c oxidase subunit II n=1 Tax=Haloarcula sp. Atlit-47R TaxID=2282132 RepID=UPI00267A9ECC